MSKSKIIKVALACAVLLIGLFIILSRNSKIQTYTLESVDEASLKAANVIFLFGKNLYAAPKEGEYRILLHENVQNAVATDYGVYFDYQSNCGDLRLAQYNIENGFSFEPKFYYATARDTGYLNCGIKWFGLRNGHPSGVLEEKLRLQTDHSPYLVYICDQFVIGAQGLALLESDYTGAFDEASATQFESKDKVLVDGWGITKKGNTLVFVNGNTTNKISGNSLFLVGAI